MERFYNATKAAQEIGISYKTMLRRIEEGKIAATKGEDNQFLVAESEVEKHKRQRIQFVHSRPVKTTPSSEHLTSVDQSELLSRVANLERRVAELENNARDTASQDQKALVPTSQQKTEVDKSTPTSPQIRPSQPSSNIPDDWTLCSDFFESHSIKETTYRRWLTNGISGDYFEFEEIPVSDTNSKKYRYFSPTQKEKALELLKKHGKLPSV